jgi:predicted nucleic acid-binding protein
VIVLDASAVVELLLWSPAGQRVAARIAKPKETLHAPHLLDVEVTQVLRRAERSGLVSAERAREALLALVDLDIERHEHGVLLNRVWALRQNCTAYDAVYVALAEALQAPLLTLDTRLAEAPGTRAKIEVA